MKKLIVSILALLLLVSLWSAYAEYTDSDTILAVQQALADLGIYKGNISGIKGNATEAAIRTYQQKNGLKVNGQIDDSLLESLGLGASTLGELIPTLSNDSKLYDLYSQVLSQIQLNRLSNISAYKSVTNYDDIERNPNKHTGEKLCFEGTVIQVIEGSTTTYRISMDQYGNNMFLITYEIPDGYERFLKDDLVCVYAEFVELHTYQSTTNLSVTVPYCSASLIMRPVTNKYVTAATPEELNEAIGAIRDRLDKVVAKENGYTLLTKSNYEDFARHEKLHANEKITFTGKVAQALEGTKENIIRLAVESDSSKIIYLTYDPNLISIRVLDDDTLNVKGIYSGLYTYSSIKSGEITIPSVMVESLEVKGYKAPSNISKDRDGNCKITKTVYEDYARQPSKHTNEKITFSATVLQVIEGTTESAYRMAIDNDSNCVFYVTLSKDNRTMRILQDDKVTVVGTFDGLMSYQSTLGATITIPQCNATSVVVPGKASSVAQKDANGYFKVTKANYESFARDEDTYMNKPITFTAKVIQVVDGKKQTVYRMAVDKNSDAMFLATIDNSALDVRIMEDDIVTIEATSTGLYSYNSTLGGKITIPSCAITKYSIQGYVKKDLGSPNTEGYYKITKSNYDEIARNPDPYKNKNVTFTAKVIQVAEGNKGTNHYRVTVDSDYNCVFYVEYTLPTGSSRILENDVIILKGEYYGIYTYQTILGASVSVPALIATDAKKAR